MPDKSALDTLVTGIGGLMVAGGNIVAAIMGKDRIAPPIKDLALLNRLTHIVAAIAAIAMLGCETGLAKSELTRLALLLLVVSVILALAYIIAVRSLTIECEDDPQTYLTGLWKVPSARALLRKGQERPGEGPADVQDFFCNNDRNAGQIWSRWSRNCAQALLALAYAAMVFAFTATLSAGWLAFTANPRESSQPAPPAHTLVVPDDLLFELGKAELSDVAARQLADIADQLRRSGTREIEISGHTDSIGSEQANLQLSERRAAAVYEWLSSLPCMKTVRISVISSGESRPIAPNVRWNGADYPEGRKRNRRVEIKFTPLDPDIPRSACSVSHRGKWTGGVLAEFMLHRIASPLLYFAIRPVARGAIS